MFTLEESALLRRMLHAVMWFAITAGVAALFFLSRPWLPDLAWVAGWLVRR